MLNVANPSRETTPLLRPPHSDLGVVLNEGFHCSRLSPNPSNLCSRSMATRCCQTIPRLKLNLSTTLWSYFITNSCFTENLSAFGKISFLSLTPLLLCFGIRMLDIQAFHYHKTHKNNSNHVAVLVFTCCAPPIYTTESCGHLEWYVGIGVILTHFQHYGCMFFHRCWLTMTMIFL